MSQARSVGSKREDVPTPGWWASLPQQSAAFELLVDHSAAGGAAEAGIICRNYVNSS